MVRQWLKVLFLLALNIMVVVLLGTHYIWRHAQAFVDESQQALTFIASPQAFLWTTKSVSSTGDVISVANLSAMQQHMQQARVELEALQVVVNPILSVTGASPLGTRSQEMVALWQFADNTNHLANELLALVQMGVISVQDDAPIEHMLATLPQMRPHLVKVEGYLADAQAAREQIGEATWLPSPLQAVVQNGLADWDRFAPQLAMVLPLSQEATHALPAFLGHQQPTTYLVLIQNHDELRATGGFITGVGMIEIENGQLADFTVGKVLDAEAEEAENWQDGVKERWVQPPLPISRYMRLGNWAFRDVNWMADFPTTAQQAAEFWLAQKGSTVDGVIALNEEALAAIVGALGPVQLASGQEITDQNLKQVTLSHVYEGKRTEWSRLQAEVSLELAHALQKRIQKAWIEQFSARLSAGDLQTLAESLHGAFVKRALLIHSFDSQVASLLRELDVDGALPTAGTDYFYLVEQNVSYNKLSQFIEQTLTYTVTLDVMARPIESVLTVEERNLYQEGAGWAEYPAEYYFGTEWEPGSNRLPTSAGYYGGYTTLYLPKQVQLTMAEGFDDEPIYDDGSIGAYVGLFPQETQQLIYKWTHQPTSEASGQYHLVVPRQPGAPVHELTITINLPKGYEAIQIYPTPTEIKSQQLIWQTTLEQTQHFRLQLQPTF